MRNPGDTPANKRVNAAHSDVTAPAYGGRRRAAGRARYAQRWAYLSGPER